MDRSVSPLTVPRLKAPSMADRVRIAAHAKANLFLRILAREESGYHSLETLYTLLDLHDDLTVERTGSGIELTVDGDVDVGPAEENLAYRAAEMVLQATGNRFGVALHLKKSIPVKAGLGGGSSDGAAALHAVNHLAEGAVPRHEILQFAARLGSDVPFFASGAAMALGWGRGERLFRLTAPRASPVLLAVPAFGISTKHAYEFLATARQDAPRRGGVLLDFDAFGSWGGIGRLSGNDFESVLFGKEPRLRELFERLAETRPLLARLCGSGSAVIGIYKNEADRENAATALGESKQRLIRTGTRFEPAPGCRPVE